MASPKYLSVSGTTSPFRVTLDSPITLKTLYLKSYTFDGVPVSSGYPDESTYNLVIEDNNGGSYIPLITTGTRGIPLNLTASHTEKIFETPLQILNNSNTTFLKFTIRLLNASNGTDATTTKVSLLFEYL